MTSKEIIKLAKEQYGRDITEAEARAVLDKLNEAAVSGELSDDALESVSGGGKMVALLQDIFNNLGKLL